MNRERLSNFIRNRLIYVKAATLILWSIWIGMIAYYRFERDIKGDPIGTDHIAFYTAGRFIGEGRGTSIYDLKAVGDYQTALTRSENWLLDAYRNPPFYALLYVPTSRLPYLWSFWIWTGISLVMLAMGIIWLGARKPGAVFVLAYSFYPVFSAFSFGQNSLLSFGFFGLTFFFLERRRYFIAGLASGLLLFKPQLLLGLGIWWLLGWRRYWTCLAGLAAMSCLIGLLSFLVLPEESRIYLQKLTEIARYDAFFFWNLHNPRAFGTLIACDNKRVGDVAGLICLAAALIAFVWFWRRHRDNQPVMFAAAVFVTLWASPHSMIYEWTLALIPAILLWDREPEHRQDWLILFAISWAVLFVSTPIAKTLFEWTANERLQFGWAIQISVPVMAWVAIQAARVLNRPRGMPGVTAASSACPPHPSSTGGQSP